MFYIEFLIVVLLIIAIILLFNLRLRSIKFKKIYNKSILETQNSIHNLPNLINFNLSSKEGSKSLHVKDLLNLNLKILSLREELKKDESINLSILHNFIRNILNDYANTLWQCNFSKTFVNSNLDNIKSILLFATALGLENTAYKYNQAINFMYMMLYDAQEIINIGDKFKECPDCYNNDFSDTWKFYILSLKVSGREQEAKEFLNKFIEVYGIEKVHNYLPFADFALQNGYSTELIQQSASIMHAINKDNNSNIIKGILHDKSIAIVGNSRDIFDNKTGKEIDSHDVVIRFNNYQIKGYEEFTGTKTSIWAYNGDWETKDREIKDYDAVLIFIHNTYQLSDEKIHNIYKYLTESNTKIIFYPISFHNEVLKQIQHWTTTGTYLSYLLIKLGFKPSLYGFQDPKKLFKPNYFEKNASNRPISWHHMDLESEFIKSLLENKEK
ncbi:MAG: glycosyltransferase family 29 protein [Alphaproteobacteria bacterium]|nr:glycosyltransferase family 29 protein [Alphaproteobacteria bacterium]